jgi:hypothetical protein
LGASSLRVRIGRVNPPVLRASIRYHGRFSCWACSRICCVAHCDSLRRRLPPRLGTFLLLFLMEMVDVVGVAGGIRVVRVGLHALLQRA